MLERIGRVNRFMLWALPVAALLCLVGLGFIYQSIDTSVKEYAAHAQTAQPHPNDDAMALIEYLRLLERLRPGGGEHRHGCTEHLPAIEQAVFRSALQTWTSFLV